MPSCAGFNNANKSMSVLTRTTYKPKMNDPRVRARIALVLDYFSMTAESGAETDLRASTIRKVIGNVHTKNTLAEWLFANILVQEKGYKVGLYSKSYFIRREGYVKVMTLLEATRTPENEASEMNLKVERELDEEGLATVFGL